MVARSDVLADLADESASLEAIVADLSDEGWATSSAAKGWTVADQVGHLAWTDEQALCAATAPAQFAARMARLATGSMSVDSAAHAWAERSPQELLAAWRAGREGLALALADLPTGTRLPWFGPPMSPVSMATARIMETWAHGQDVVDALGVNRQPTARLRHIAHLAVRTRDFAFAANRLPAPTEEFLVRLGAPGGQEWVWGPADAAQSVTGSALDLCLVATQRRHRDDTDLTATGPDAQRWLEIAQAFAGPPGSGRHPGGRDDPAGGRSR